MRKVLQSSGIRYPYLLLFTIARGMHCLMERMMHLEAWIV